jgi:hypothetical protein
MQLGYVPIGLSVAREVIWCPKCGQHIYGEVDDGMILEIEKENYGVAVRWSGEQVSVQEISLMRMLDPNLQEKPLEAVARLLRRSTHWRIENLSRNHAHQILKVLQAKGVTADWI